ncbi:type IV pilin-like G/H family protein [Spirulina major CS-329]|uniref:type IV pilin-like G/H family protein n=1 Tax=Spirulina TaxID=1154 RepID=UPI00232F5512|nr:MULTISPECIES: type IV pilin-like G/H family protein [Spirulina]MDB9495424.1 type IV pilin-like G/H family protein [Spirulina subsalsa CS-330]MDB9504072.1 type IV pilin-like G/H family protein [Spirulina major CS-329]
MKPEFQAKFLQYLNSTRKEDEGFTLIELLVVIIIIGILAAIALPSLLGQANKAKQSEARNNIGALMRGQQASYLESQSFQSDILQLGLGVATQTVNYRYQIMTNNTSTAARIYATPIKPSLKAYIGVVATEFSGAAGGNNAGEATTQASLCESIKVTSLQAGGNTFEPAPKAPTVDGAPARVCANLGDSVGGSTQWKDLGA